ncbi:hypothetical protein F0562_035843 [Nyssa sinensis]|uniref:F-box protein GID2 n=1 Tax=Nyssa sinensis TaxID=561372 RepID=A0A5J5AE73_9ASTE|nr:hypothetical protein F0562_035843 [Nyssa sinensis]
MKRPVDAAGDPETCDDKKMKKIKTEEKDDEGEVAKMSVLMDENLLYEVMKHVDARTLATAGCVSKQWHKTAQDERLWELICTRHWPNIGCGNQQLRSVVLALGGFRRLHSQYPGPLSKPSSSSSSSPSSAWPCLRPPTVTASKPTNTKTRWGKDECVVFSAHNERPSTIPFQRGGAGQKTFKFNPPTTLKPLALFLVLFLISSSIFIGEARPLNAAKPHKSVDKAMANILVRLYIEAIKNEGPSPGGKGHEFTNAHTLMTKNCGPSPGAGH